MPELKDLKVKITFEADTHSLYLAQADTALLTRVAANMAVGNNQSEQSTHAALRGLLAECMAERDAYRARCPVVANDVGPAHTAERVLAYALANGWQASTYHSQWYWLPDVGATRILTQEHANKSAMLDDCVRFCRAHAQSTGLAPLDVLAAIGKMP